MMRMLPVPLRSVDKTGGVQACRQLHKTVTRETKALIWDAPPRRSIGMQPTAVVPGELGAEEHVKCLGRETAPNGIHRMHMGQCQVIAPRQ